MNIIVFAAMFLVLLVALEPHHRRTSSLPRAPFGADAELDHDLERVLHDAPMAGEHSTAASRHRAAHRPARRRGRRRLVRRFAP